MKQDPNCLFCKIVSGAIPSTKVLEDDAALAFLDIGPLARGHVLLIPKDHYMTADQMPCCLAAAVLKHLPALISAVQSVTSCQGVNVLQNNGRAARQLVPHVHFHIIPRNTGDEFQFNWPAGSYPAGEAERLAKALREKLS
jgi:histidine triad (HIT) family protein